MTKILQISEKLSEIHFNSPQQDFNLYYQAFLETELGKIYQSIPWSELIKSMKLGRYKTGRKSLLDHRGMLALMFLKSYTRFSDKMLIEHLNSNIDLQLFCGVLITPENRIENFKIVSRIRTELGKKLNIKKAQQVLAQSWKPYLTATNVMLTDATCYESELRHPTNVKLLWESVDFSYTQMKLICKSLGIRRPRCKYSEQKDKYYAYQRKRRKPEKGKIARTRSLLYLLRKLLDILDELQEQHKEKLILPQKYYDKIKVLHKVYYQQHEMFEKGGSLPGRIVSISKNYIRPIVRGKERKKVEFGPKVNMIQVDGINFIEHLSFDPFNEGTRLISSIWLARALFGKTTHLSADAIYATNKNRRYCTSSGITTNFARKGRAGKHEVHRKIISKELNKERATRMEGSFGTEKEHYNLQKIKAKTEPNEVLWVFFGVHTANAVRIARKKSEQQHVQKAA